MTRGRIESRRCRRQGAGAFALFFLVACAPASPDRQAASPGAAPKAEAPADPPIGATTDPDKALADLDGAIAVRRAEIARPHISWVRHYGAASALVDLLLRRAHFLGTVDDYTEALAVAHQVARRHAARDPRALLVEARALAAVHRFDDSARLLDQAAARGVPGAELLGARASIWLARGETRRALEAARTAADRHPTLGNLTMLAIVLGDLGRIDAAEHQFRRALAGRMDGDPFPVARLYFHRGRMWERQGRPALAKRYYQLAYQRFPRYAPLAAHLAGLEARAGESDQAIARLRAILKRSRDPEHLGQLGGLLRDTGRTPEAALLLAAADQGYRRLLESLPLAFADHAARFYLRVENDPERALELAQLNLANRASDESLQLYLDAADATRQRSDETCDVAEKAARRSGASAYLLFASARALRTCGDKALAARAIAAARVARRQR